MMTGVAVYFGLILARVGTFVAIMPLFAGRTPRLVRVNLAIILAIFYFVAVGPRWDAQFAKQAADLHWLAYALALVRESLIGAAMGFAFSMFLLPARIAGEFVAQQIGLGTSPLLGLSSDTPAAALTLVFETAASVIFLELNGHHLVLAAMHASFDRFPLGGALVPQPVLPMLNGLSSAHQMGLLIAGPLAMCMFLLTVILAIAARAAPQLNIFTLGFTLQIIVAFLGALFLLPDILRVMVLVFGRTGHEISRFMG